jgi:hypothetical protein
MTPLHVLRDTATGVLMFFFVSMLAFEACASAFR